MTKQQLIEKVAAKTELKKSEVEVAVDSVLAMIAEALRSFGAHQKLPSSAGIELPPLRTGSRTWGTLVIIRAVGAQV
jgi:hypothetical protein